MACIKCGKKTENEQVFCPQCLAVTEVYPVNSDIPIQLPRHRNLPQQKKVRRKRRNLSPEEQLTFLLRRQRRLVAVIVLLALLICGLVAALLYSTRLPEKLEWGTNYIFENPIG